MSKKSTKEVKKVDKKKAIKTLTERLVDLLNDLGYETTNLDKNLKKISKKLVSQLPIKSQKTDKLATTAKVVDTSNEALKETKAKDAPKTTAKKQPNLSKEIPVSDTELDADKGAASVGDQNAKPTLIKKAAKESKKSTETKQ